MEWKRCDNCGNWLGVFERQSDRCNECLLLPHEDELYTPEQADSPAVPDSDPPIPAEIRSYSDWAIECREAA